jgi:polysaccharide deacetylase family protein (PEP-CTERM system associated)
MRNVLSIDLEEYFHPSEVQPFLQGADWSKLPSRVESQTIQILELLAKHDTSATFFVVGWVAEKHPRLLREIAAAGHEIGCHSYAHQLVYNLRPEEFRRDTQRCMDAIADACGAIVRAYRAPSYSITRKSMWALEILVQLGFTHDSSIYPISHDRYGIPGFNRYAQRIETSSGSICEVPIATVSFPNGRTAPVGGGAYLRLLPYRYTAAGIRRLNIEEGQPACVYFHPWEIDPHQPQLATSFIARMRTYTGLRSMMSKLDRLLNEFQFFPMSTVHPVPLVTASSTAMQAYA